VRCPLVAELLLARSMPCTIASSKLFDDVETDLNKSSDRHRTPSGDADAKNMLLIDMLDSGMPVAP